MKLTDDKKKFILWVSRFPLLGLGQYVTHLSLRLTLQLELTWKGRGHLIMGLTSNANTLGLKFKHIALPSIKYPIWLNVNELKTNIKKEQKAVLLNCPISLNVIALISANKAVSLSPFVQLLSAVSSVRQYSTCGLTDALYKWRMITYFYIRVPRHK